MPMKRGSDGRPVNVPTQRSKSGAAEPASPRPPASPKLNLGDEPTGASGDRAKPADSSQRGGLGFWPRDNAPTVSGGQRRTPPDPLERGSPEGRSPDDTPTGATGNRRGSPDDWWQPADRDGRAQQASLREQAAPRKTPEREEPTVLVHGRQPPERGDQPDTSARPADLPTGWLVVVDGLGKGTVLPLGFGHNTIGRGAGVRVRLNFGDSAISREHTAIRYSDRNNAFHIFPGSNNVYLAGNEEVLVPTPLPSGCLIGLGETTLRFVPFCDESFRWD